MTQGSATPSKALETLAEYVRRKLAEAPPVDEDTRARLRALMSGGKCLPMPMPMPTCHPIVAASASAVLDPNRATVLYRFYDHANRLLYVGVSYDPDVRHQQHLVSSQWAPLIARRADVWYDSRSEALAAEAEAVVDEHPLFNIQHRKRLPNLLAEA